MADELHRLEGWIGDIADRVSPAARRAFTRDLAAGLRQRQRERIARQENPDGTPFEPRKKGGRIRRRAEMFQALRKARHLRAVSDAEGLAVGFSGRTAEIARIHQEGQQAPVERDGPLYRYPARRLLGWTVDDRAWVAEQAANLLG